MVRAAVENAEAGFEARQGGSTITQQLVKNLYIQDPDETVERKIREAKLAMELEDEHSKGWILNQYLNTASYGTNDGRTAVGVEAASEVYFDKNVQRPRPQGVGAARRPAPGALRIQPVPQPARGQGPPQRGARQRWPSRATSAPPSTRSG